MFCQSIRMEPKIIVYFVKISLWKHFKEFVYSFEHLCVPQRVRAPHLKTTGVAYDHIRFMRQLLILGFKLHSETSVIPSSFAYLCFHKLCLNFSFKTMVQRIMQQAYQTIAAYKNGSRVHSCSDEWLRFPSFTNTSVVALSGSKQQELAQLRLCFWVFFQGTPLFYHNYVHVVDIKSLPCTKISGMINPCKEEIVFSWRLQQL